MTKVERRIIAALFVGGLSFVVGCTGKHEPAVTQTSQSDSIEAGSSSAGSGATISDARSYEQRQGKHLFMKYCTVCHGEEGKGDGFNAFNLEPKPRDFTDRKSMEAMSDDRIIQTITGGGRSVNRSSLMPSWGGRMKKEEIKYVLSYIRTFASSR